MGMESKAYNADVHLHDGQSLEIDAGSVGGGENAGTLDDSGDVKAVVENSIQGSSEEKEQNISKIDRVGISEELANWRQRYSTSLNFVKNVLQAMPPNVFRRLGEVWSNEGVGQKKLALYFIVVVSQRQLLEGHEHAFRLVADIEDALGEVADGEISSTSVARDVLDEQKKLADSFFEKWFKYLQKSKVSSSKDEGQTDTNKLKGEKDEKEEDDDESQNLYRSLLEDYREMEENYKEIEKIFREIERELRKDRTLIEKSGRRIEEALGGN